MNLIKMFKLSAQGSVVINGLLLMLFIAVHYSEWYIFGSHNLVTSILIPLIAIKIGWAIYVIWNVDEAFDEFHEESYEKGYSDGLHRR